MCGIAGFIDSGSRHSSGLLRAVAERMAAALAHRGPDRSGVWCDPRAGIGLGFRRLAILDLAPTGDQPMVSSNQRYVTVFNGEIYNFAELRRELEGLGHRFRGHSDTEVLLASVVQWGVLAGMQRQRGMFACAVWDCAERVLYLARDRLGIKPLYYGRVGGGFAFASELGPFRACPGFVGELNPLAIAQYLRFGYVSGPFCIYAGLHKLLPGHVLRLPEGSTEGSAEAYWTLDSALAAAGSQGDEGGEEEWVDAAERELQAAVSRHMVADVPVGAFLSGGIDSSLVVALMQSQSRDPVRTFSIGFADPKFDEAPYAKAIAGRLGTDHTEVYVAPADVVDAVPRMSRIYDEPFADSSQIPTWLVSRLARASVTVALSGDGGDELFAGYNRYAFAPRAWHASRRVPRGVRPLLAALLARSARPTERLLAHFPHTRVGGAGMGDKLVKLAWVLQASSPDDYYDRLSSLGPDSVGLLGNPGQATVAPSQQPCRVEAMVGRMQYFDLLTYLPDDILTKVDRASMAVGLEARVPLLDDEVVAFALRVPAAFHIRHGRTKWLLRRVLERHLPTALFERPKAGFAMPIGDWLRGPLRDWAEPLIYADHGVVEAAAARRLWLRHLAGHGQVHREIWAVLMLHAWIQDHGDSAADGVNDAGQELSLSRMDAASRD